MSLDNHTKRKLEFLDNTLSAAIKCTAQYIELTSQCFVVTYLSLVLVSVCIFPLNRILDPARTDNYTR